MPLFECTKCNCVENTALSNYWVTTIRKQTPPVCSGCDPEIGQWHGEFPQRKISETALVKDQHGFLQEPKSP